MTYYGDVQEAVRHYLDSFNSLGETPADEDLDRRPGSGELRIISAIPDAAYYECAAVKRIKFRIEQRKPSKGKYFISCHLFNEAGVDIMTCDSRLLGHWIDPCEAYEGEFVLSAPWLKPGRYRLEMFICGGNIIDRWEEACFFDVIPILPYPDPSHPHAVTDGLVFADFDWQGAPVYDARPLEAASAK
jgi:lipopolysaccharide transport system ATP-binding protein